VFKSFPRLESEPLLFDRDLRPLEPTSRDLILIPGGIACVVALAAKVPVFTCCCPLMLSGANWAKVWANVGFGIAKGETKRLVSSPFAYRAGRTRTCNPRFWRPVLCQLSYGPRRSHDTPVRRRPLGALFLMLAAGFAGIGFVAAREGGRAWVIAVAAGALAVWMGELAFRTLR
jgi:hypothetical protein